MNKSEAANENSKSNDFVRLRTISQSAAQRPGTSSKAAIAQELAEGYSSGFRVVEISSIVLFTGLMIAFFVGLTRLQNFPLLAVAIGFAVGWLAADFISGLVHWGADTWGSVKIPVIGPTLIRSFREHHVDPMAITRHDFAETNGASCMITLPFLITGVYLVFHASSPLVLLAAAACASLSFFTLMTNQAHQWAHHGRNVSPMVKLLQKVWIVLPNQVHAVHHRAPFTESYCITTGWFNPLLNRIGFFRGLEAAITKVTGAIPRAEDLVLTGVERPKNS